MDFLNWASTQVNAVLRSIQARPRIAGGLLLSMIIAGLILMVLFRNSDSYEYLFSGKDLPRRQVEAMEIAFAKHGLNDCKVTGNRIRVPARKKHEYLVALAEEGALPESFDLNQPPPKFGLFASRQEIEAQIRIEDENKLARLIERMPEIEEAAVHIDEFKIGGFPAKVEKRAIALVSGVDECHLSDHQLLAIRETVTGYVAGIHPENVTVTDLVAMRAFTGAMLSEVPHRDNTYDATSPPHENDLTTSPKTTPVEPPKSASWLKEHWFMVLLAVVGVILFILVRASLRPQQGITFPATENEVQPTPEIRDEAAFQMDSTNPTSALSNDGNSLREQLAKMVDQDPDRAANVLRDWIKDVA